MIRKINKKFAEIQERRADGDKGFTLIELLIVIIIIGILAAIAVPIYLNQQKTARDAATTSDVKNVATNIHTLLVKDSAADAFTVADTTADDGKVNVTVGTSGTLEVAVSNGTQIAVEPGDNDGEFRVYGYNENGSSYNGTADALVYDSAKGGLQDAVGAPTVATPVWVTDADAAPVTP